MTKLKRLFTCFSLFVANMNGHDSLMAACLFVVGLANDVARGLTGGKP